MLSLDTDGSELDFAIEENSPFFLLIHLLASSDAILCSLQDDDACNPQTIAEAKCSKYWTNWLAAIHEELESLKTKGVYEEVSSVPRDRKAVQCKWVLHIKRIIKTIPYAEHEILRPISTPTTMNIPDTPTPNPPNPPAATTAEEAKNKKRRKSKTQNHNAELN